MKLHVSPLTGRVVSRAGKGNIGLDHARLDLIGGDPGWLDDTTFVSMGVIDGKERIVRYDTRTGQASLALDVTGQPVIGGANVVRAGGGRWARWLNVPNVGLQDNTGLHLPLAGLLDIGPDATLYYTENYQAGKGIRARYLGGTDIEVQTTDRATARELRAFYGGCVWGSYAQQAWLWTRNTGPLLLETVAGEPVFDPSLVIANDGEEWLVYGTQTRIYAHPRADWRTGYVLHTGRDDFYYPHAVIFNGLIRCAYSADQGAGGLSQRIIACDLEAPRRQLYPFVPAIGRKMWLGFFNRVQPTTSLPGNCSFYFGAGSDGLIRDSQGHPFAAYAAGAPGQEGNLASLNAAIVTAKRHGLPVLAYWTRALWSGPLPTGADWLGVEGYEQRSEGFANFEQSLIRQCQRHPCPALIGQCYTSNTNNTSELTHLPAIFARVAIRFPAMPIILLFTGEGRGTGFTDHPEAAAPFGDLAAGITGAPEIPMPAPSAKATIVSFETPVTIVNGEAVSRAVLKVTQGTPTRVMWQYEDRPGHWADASNPAPGNPPPPGNDPHDLDHHYRFTVPGRYAIRLQTFVNGVLTDQSNSTSRVIEVRAAVVVPPEPPVVEPPAPQPGPHEVLITLRDTRGIPIADAEAWSQAAPTVKVKTNLAGHALVIQPVSGTGVCVLKEGYHSPGLPNQPQTCVLAAPGASVDIVYEQNPPPPPPPGQVHGPLRLDAEGRFVDDVGLYQVRGISEFDLLHLARVGQRPFVEAQLNAARSNNRNLVRVFGSAQTRLENGQRVGLFDLNPDQPSYDDALTWLIAAAASRGIRILFVVFCDAQVIYPNHSDRVRVLSHLADRFGAQPALLWAVANEAFKNGWSEADDPKLFELADLLAVKLGHRNFIISDPKDGDSPDVSAEAVEKQKRIAAHANIITLHPSRKGGAAPSEGHYRRWVNHLESSVDMIKAVRNAVGAPRQILLDEPMGHAGTCTGSRECEADAALAGAMVAACTGQPYVYHRIAAQDMATPGLDLIKQFEPLVPVDGQYLNDHWPGSPSAGFTKWDKVRWRVKGNVGIGVANGIEKGTITYANGWVLDAVLYDGPHCQILKVKR